LNYLPLTLHSQHRFALALSSFASTAKPMLYSHHQALRAIVSPLQAKESASYASQPNYANAQ
jgi:hypothetical protein